MAVPAEDERLDPEDPFAYLSQKRLGPIGGVLSEPWHPSVPRPSALGLERPLFEGAWRRAWADASRAYAGTRVRGAVVLVTSAAAGVAAVVSTLPTASRLQTGLAAAAGVLLGPLVVGLVVLAYQRARAVRRQRNEARYLLLKTKRDVRYLHDVVDLHRRGEHIEQMIREGTWSVEGARAHLNRWLERVMGVLIAAERPERVQHDFRLWTHESGLETLEQWGEAVRVRIWALENELSLGAEVWREAVRL